MFYFWLIVCYPPSSKDNPLKASWGMQTPAFGHLSMISRSFWRRNFGCLIFSAAWCIISFLLLVYIIDYILGRILGGRILLDQGTTSGLRACLVRIAHYWKLIWFICFNALYLINYIIEFIIIIFSYKFSPLICTIISEIFRPRLFGYLTFAFKAFNQTKINLEFLR